MKPRIFFRTKNKERGYDLESQYDQSEESRPRTGIPPRPKAEGFISENKSTEEPVENPAVETKENHIRQNHERGFTMDLGQLLRAA
ncbi:hypothetical protein [Leptospira santarosai]|uniref:hypothetical protein n=1 Tax=Leptospira santarosai TaxID=28183 RepID=UPI0002BFCA23|nr:hypothetical protein [Leptospira santarosai]EMM78972.1 hypothetical protein LEP1GSC040_2326 [Leptospira santarosai str. 2000030832]